MKDAIEQLEELETFLRAPVSLGDGLKLAYGDFVARCLYSRYFQE